MVDGPACGGSACGPGTRPFCGGSGVDESSVVDVAVIGSGVCQGEVSRIVSATWARETKVNSWK